MFWNRNCIALGLGSGFIEPLESTSIHLIMQRRVRIARSLPGPDFDPVNIAHYNKTVIDEFERVRDFIVLHYCTTQRTDTPYWERCRQIKLPDDLRGTHRTLSSAPAASFSSAMRCSSS